MTDYQVIRKKLAQNCVTSLEEQIQKNRLKTDEIQRTIFSEVAKKVKDAYEGEYN